MSKQDPEASEPEAEPTFDGRLSRLEQIVTTLEEGDLELEAAIGQYKEGVSLLKDGRDLRGGFGALVEELTGEAQASLRPYADDPDADRA